MNLKRSFPQDFVNRISSQFPKDSHLFLNSLSGKVETSIRYNINKYKGTIGSDRVLWSEHGVFLEQRPSFTLIPEFHAGHFYVQESSSMFLDYVLTKLKSEIRFDRVLDLCAAPGGKTTIILDHLDTDQYVLANEIIPNRNQILRENLIKWGKPNFLITQNSPRDFEKLKNHFDLILLDAPCSGEGMFRKDAKAIDEWSIENAEICSQRQENIWKSIWPSIKDGGVIIYSTCTFNPYENELFLSKMKDLGFCFDSISIDLKDDWNISRIVENGIEAYQFLPHRVRGEGFFISVLRKRGNYNTSHSSQSKSIIDARASKYINRDEFLSFSTYQHNQFVYLAPNRLLDNFYTYQKLLTIKQLGFDLGKMEFNGLIPNHSMAMINHKSREITSIELNKEEALNYLSGNCDDLILDNMWTLVKYHEADLGWIFKDKNGTSNKYPKAWQIKMDWRGFSSSNVLDS